MMQSRERGIGPRELTLPIVALAMVSFGAFARTDAVSVTLIVVGAGMFFIGTLLPALTEFQIGPSGFSAKLRERDEEVQTTLEPHTESLMRTAVLLAGSPEAGQELLDKALIETYLRWQQAKREGPAEAVRKHLGDLAPSAADEAPAGDAA
jgi:hypothetical protein